MGKRPLGICINRFCFCPYLSTTPRTRERILRQCILPHGNLTPPRISARRPHWLRRLTALFVPLQRSACDWTQVSLLLLLFMAFGADAPHRPTQKVVWLIGFADGRRKVKDALYYSVFKERTEAIEKAPSLSMPKS